MKRLFQKICGGEVAEREGMDAPTVDAGQFGHIKFRLLPEVRVQQSEDALGEPCYCLSLPDRSPCHVSAEIHEVISRLDGERTLLEAVSETLEKGDLPVGLEKKLCELARGGFLEGPEEGLQRLSSEASKLEEIETRAKEKIQRFWGRDIPGPPVFILVKALKPIARLLSIPTIFWTAMTLGFVGLLLFKPSLNAGDTSVHPVGAHSFFCELFGLWFFSNIASLIRGAAASLHDPNDRGIVSWKLFGGIPLLKPNDEILQSIDWRTALRNRMAGVALLWALAFIGTALLGLGPDLYDQGCVSVVVACYVVGFLHLSPWWRSPLKASFSQANPGVDFPWICWNYIWKGFWGALFGNRSLAKGEARLIATTIFVFGWTVLALRIGAFVLKNSALQLYIDSHNSESPIYCWLLCSIAIGIAVVCAVVALNVILLFAIRGIRSLIFLPLWKVHRNLFLTFLGLGAVLAGLTLVLPDQVSPYFRWSSYLALYVLNAVLFGLSLRSDDRNLLSPALFILTVWTSLSAVTLLGEKLVWQAAPEEVGTYMRWFFLLPLAAASFFPATFSAYKGKRLPLWAAGFACLVVIGIDWITPLSLQLAIVCCACAAALNLLWGMLQVGGWYRRLSYYLASVFAFLATSGALFAISGRGILRQDSFLYRLSPGLWGLCLMLVIPLTLRFLLGCRPIQRCLTVEDNQTRERELLFQAINHFWEGMQGHVAWIAGKPATQAAQKAAQSASQSLVVESSGLREGGDSVSDMDDLSEELDRAFAAANHVWMEACGRSAISNSGKVCFLSLPGPHQEVFRQYLLRPGGWWTVLFPETLTETGIDPRSFLQDTHIFPQLSEEHQQLILEQVKLRFYKPGETVVRMGERRSEVFIIAQGTAEIVAENHVLGSVQHSILRQKERFGSTSFLTGSPQPATVRALGELCLFGIERKGLESVIPEIKKFLPSDVAERKMKRLSSTALFSNLAPLDLELLAERSNYRNFAAATEIVKQGDAGDTFYVIEKGEVEVTKNGDVLARLGPGEFFGETALLLSVPRTTNVTAASDCVCIVVSSLEFKRVVAP